MDQTTDPSNSPSPPPAQPAPRQRSRWPLTILALVLVAVVAIVQRPGAPDPVKMAQAKSGSVVDPVSINPLVAVGKGLLMLKSTSKQPIPDLYLDFVDSSARTAPDRFRAAILMGELRGEAEREARFAALDKDLDPGSPLRQDIQTVRQLTASPAEQPDAAAIEGFKERHGWFARLILVKGDPAAEKTLQDQIDADGMRLVAVIVAFGIFLVVAILSGIAVLIVAIVQFSSGSLRFRFARTPEALGSDRGLWLETFCVFLAAFLAVHFAGMGLSKLGGKGAAWPVALLLLLQWSLVLVVFWPIARGMSWERFRGELGWHRGRGIFREIGAGILGYLAGLPIYFLMALIVTAAMMIRQAIAARGKGGPPQDMPVPDNKVFDLIGGSNGWVLLILGSLIVLWAPLVEESIFRGALYRHLRGRFAVVVSVLLVAAAFALAHAYVLAGVIMVATLGGIFALMREWRGSLIAPMTAHCLHNSMVLTLLLALLPVMRG